MPDNREIKIIISADSRVAVAEMQKVSTTAQSMSADASDIGVKTSTSFGMMRSALTAITAAIASAAAGLYAFKKALQPIEDYQQNIAQMTALTITFMEKTQGMSLAEQYRVASQYAQSIVPVLEQIAAKTLLSSQETIELNTALQKQGIFINANNQSAVQGFISLSNAIAVLTQSQSRSVQLQQEIRALFGQGTEAGASLLQMIKAQDPAIENNIKKWRAQGTLWENIMPYLQGFNSISGQLEMTWGSLSTTLKSTFDNILRVGLKDAYDSTVEWLSSLNRFLHDNSSVIKSELAGAWHTVKTVFESLMMIIKPLWDLVRPIVSVLIEGFQILANTILPIIAEKIGAVIEFVRALMSSVLKIFQTATALLKGDTDTVKKIFKEWADDGKSMADAWGKIFDKGLGDSIARRYNEYQRIKEQAKKETRDNIPDVKGKPQIDHRSIAEAAKLEAIRLQNQINAAKEMLEIEKMLSADMLDVIQDRHKRGLMADKEYNEAIIQSHLKNYMEDISLLDKMIPIVNAKYNALKSEAIAKSKESGRDNTSELAELETKRLDEIRKIEIEKEKQYYKLKSDVRKEYTRYDLEQLSMRLTAHKHYIDTMMKYKEMEFDTKQNELELEKDAITRQYEQLTITAKEYYERVLDIHERSIKLKLERAEAEYNAEIELIQRTVDEYAKIGGLTDKQNQEASIKAIEAITKLEATKTSILQSAVKERASIEHEEYKATMSFVEGVAQGMREYIKQLEMAGDKGKQLFLDVAKTIEDALVKAFDKPKDAIKDIGNYFVMMIKRMAVQALASPIILPLSAVMTGVVGGIFGGGGGSAIGQASTAYAGASMLGLLPAGGLFGSGGFGGWFNNIFGSGFGSGMTYYKIPFEAGSEAAGWEAFSGGTPTALTPFGYLASGLGLGLGGYNLIRGIMNSSPLQAGLGGLGAGLGGSALLNSLVGTAINPLIGGIALALTGIFGSLLNKKKEPSISFLYNPTGDMPLWDRATYTSGPYGVSSYAMSLTAEQQRLMVEGYRGFMEGMKEMFSRYGRGDLADAFSRLGGGVTPPVHVEGKTPEEIERLMRSAWGTTVGTIIKETDENLYNLILRLQKAGEDFGEAVVRIMTAIADITNIEQSVNDFIDAINNSYDGIAKWKDQMSKAVQNIDNLWSKFRDTTDPTEQIGILNQLKNAIYEKYIAEKQMIESLVNDIEQAELAIFNFNFNLQAKIDQLTGSANASVIALSRMQYALDRFQYYQSQGNTGMSLNWLNEYISGIDSWLSVRQQEIQDRYRRMQEAEQEAINLQRERIDAELKTLDAQIRALNEQKRIIQGWANLLESLNKTITQLKITEANPQSVFERLGIAEGIVAEYLSLYQSATGEDKYKYGESLQSALMDYLNLAQEAYQRPSPEYQAIYDEVLSWLETIQREAEIYARQGESIDMQIRDLQDRQTQLQEQSNLLQQREIDYSAQMQAELDALNREAAGYYEWARNEGMRLYQQKIDELRERLASIIGDKTVEEYLADLQLAAVTELIQIRDILQRIKDQLGVNQPVIPSHKSGLDYVPYDNYPALLHRGEMVLPSDVARRYKEDSGGIVISPSITINTVKDIDEDRITGKILTAIEKSIKYGRLRTTIKEV